LSTWIFFEYFYNKSEDKFVASLKIFPINLNKYDNIYDDIEKFEKTIFNSINSNHLYTNLLTEYDSIQESFNKAKQLAEKIKNTSYESYRQTLIGYILNNSDENFQYYDEKNKFSFYKFDNLKISYFHESSEVAKNKIKALSLKTYQETENIFQYKKKFLFYMENIEKSYEQIVKSLENDVINLKKHYNNAYEENISSIESDEVISLVQFYDEFFFKIKELKIDTNSSYIKYIGYQNILEIINRYEKLLDVMKNGNSNLINFNNDYVITSEKIKYVDINTKNIKISVLETIDIKFYHLVFLSLFIFILQISILVFYNYFKYSE